MKPENQNLINETIEYLRNTQREVEGAIIARMGNVGVEYVDHVINTASVITVLKQCRQQVAEKGFDQAFKHAIMAVVHYEILQVAVLLGKDNTWPDKTPRWITEFEADVVSVHMQQTKVVKLNLNADGDV